MTFAPTWELPRLSKLDLETVRGRMIAIGAMLGCIVGLTSVSSGSMFALVLIAFFQLDAKKLVGTDLAQAAILLSFTSIAMPRPTAFKPRTCLSAKVSLWRIEAGIVRSLTWLEDGTVIALGIWKAGDVVGQTLSQVEPYQIECLSPVEATPLFLEPDQLEASLLLRHLRLQEELTVIRGYRRVDDKLLKLLNWLAHRFGHSAKAGSVIDLRLTHQDLAEILGTTRVTITRVLGQFEEQGVIERTSVRRIVLRETETWHYQI